MQKHQLAHVFRKTAELLAVGMFPSAPPANPQELIQIFGFMADQIEKDLQNEHPDTTPSDDDRTAQE